MHHPSLIIFNIFNSVIYHQYNLHSTVQQDTDPVILRFDTHTWALTVILETRFANSGVRPSTSRSTFFADIDS